MRVDRRAFVRSVLSLPVAWSFAPLIGGAGQAGGAYAAAPDNLAEYVKFFPLVESPNSLATVLRAAAYVAWAPLGSRQASIQAWAAGAMVVAGERAPKFAAQLAAQRANILDSMRMSWEEEHTPGWLRVVRSEWDEDMEQGRVWHEWTRVGYVQWVKPEDVCRSPVLEVSA